MTEGPLPENMTVGVLPDSALLPAVEASAPEGTVLPHRAAPRFPVVVGAVPVIRLGDEVGSLPLPPDATLRHFALCEGETEAAADGTTGSDTLFTVHRRLFPAVSLGLRRMNASHSEPDEVRNDSLQSLQEVARKILGAGVIAVRHWTGRIPGLLHAPFPGRS